jgi:hypothetical protein
MKIKLLVFLFIFLEISYDISLGSWFFYVLEEPIQFLSIAFFIHMLIFSFILTFNDKIIYSIRRMHDKYAEKIKVSNNEDQFFI